MISCNTGQISKDWKSLINEMPNGVLLISQEKKVLYANKSVFELLDLNVGQFPDEGFLGLFGEKVLKVEEIEEEAENCDSKPILERNFSKLDSSQPRSKSSNGKKTCLGFNPVNVIKTPLRYKIRNKGSNREFLSVSRRNIDEKAFMRKKSLDFLNLEKCSNINGDSGLLEKSSIYKNTNSQVKKSLNSKKSKNVLNLTKNNSSPNLSFKGKSILRRTFSATLNQKTNEKLESQKKSTSKNKTSEKLEINLESQKKALDFHEMLNIMVRDESIVSKVYYLELRNNRRCELKIKRILFEGSRVLLVSLGDVSYLELMQELNENNEYKNKVMTTLSHELRTPLNGVLIPLEKLMKEQPLKIEEIYSSVDIAYKSICLLQNVLNDVVDFALINSNQLYLNYEEGDIHEFLKETLELFNNQAKEKGLILQLNYDQIKKIPHNFKTDFQRLRQILVSLLNNALKNTFEGGITLHINLMERPLIKKNESITIKYSLKIFVEDSGVGIDEKKLETIKRCLQSKDLLQICAELNKKQGCGLGLIISHCLALLLGPMNSNGLELNSESKKGTEVFFLLEAFQEKEEKSNESLSVIEENKNYTTKYTSTFYNTRLFKTQTTSFSSELLKKKEKQTQRTPQGFNVKRGETMNIENDLDFSNEKDVLYSSQRISTERDFFQFSNFINKHCLETHNSDFLALNKGKALEETKEKPEILIVDDDSFNLMALEAILSKFKLKSIRAFNGEQALQKIKEKHQLFPEKTAFSLVLLDYHMPIKDGIETTEEIRRMIIQEDLKEFPIIACTAYGARDLVERWEEAGMSDFLVKPISFQRLENILRKYGAII